MSVYVSRRRPIGPVTHVLMMMLTMVVGAAGIFSMVFLSMLWTIDQPAVGVHLGRKRAAEAAPHRIWMPPPRATRNIS